MGRFFFSGPRAGERLTVFGGFLRIIPWASKEPAENSVEADGKEKENYA